MTPDNQVLLDAIREVATGVQRLDTRMDRLETRIDQLETRMDERFGQVEARLDRVEGRLDQLETRVEPIDVRTSQMAGDFRELRDRVPLLEERIDNGFRALKSDLSFAFSDTRKLTASQDRSDRTIEGLKRELASLQQRIAALEGARCFIRQGSEPSESSQPDHKT